MGTQAQVMPRQSSLRDQIVASALLNVESSPTLKMGRYRILITAMAMPLFKIERLVRRTGR